MVLVLSGHVFNPKRGRLAIVAHRDPPHVPQYRPLRILPSKAGLFDYAYDRESAMWSRDDFERVLSSIVSTPGAGRIHIVAHSMGTMLTLESLRQLHARYGDTVADRIGSVVC